VADTQGWNPRPLLAALIDAGFVNETRTVQRVVIDIQGGQSPLVYVQYEGDPDKLTGVVEQVAQAVPIVETSSAYRPKITKNPDGSWDIDGNTYWDSVTQAHRAFVADIETSTPRASLTELLAEAEAAGDLYMPLPFHREGSLAYARAVDQQPADEPDTEQGRDAAKGVDW